MDEKIQPKSIPLMVRLSPGLDERVETIVQERGYRNKANFLEDAVRFYVEFCEGRNLFVASADKVALSPN